MTASGGAGRRGPARGLRFRAETFAVLALTLALAAAYLVARDAGPFQAIEGESLDWRFRLRGPRAADAEVTIVAIDDRTLAELGRWPFSRAWLAKAVDAIAADGARVIVFDLLLVGSETGDSQDAASQEEGSPGTAADGSDRELAAAMARAGAVVVPFAFVYDPATANASVLPEAIAAAAYRVVRADPERYAALPDPPAGALVPLAAFLAAGQPAHVTVFVEADGSIRFSHCAIGYRGAYFPSLPVEAARLYFGVGQDKLSLELGQGLSIGERFYATDAEMALPIDFAGPAGTFETRSLIDVARGDFAPATFRDRLVLIGPTAAGLGDRFETPFSPMLPGVEVFANVIGNFLGQDFLRRSAEVERLDLLAIVLAGVLAAALGLLRRPALAMLAATGLIALWSVGNLYAFVILRTWLNYSFPALALLLGAALVIAGLAVRESRSRQEAERQGATLSRYVSPLAISGLRGKTLPGAADRTQTAAVLFVDLVGFTHASEDLPPAETARLLRRFHGCVERAARASGGVIDKFVGDGALLVFGVPDAGPADAANAVACALEIAGEVDGWKAEAEQAGRPGVACSAGIDFGPVSLAELGGSEHAQITVAGDTVNVASRLEALTREWGASVVISDAAREAARAAGAREVLRALEDFVELPVRQLRGRDRPIGIWAWPAPARA